MSRSMKSSSFDVKHYIKHYNPTSETRIQRLVFLARNTNSPSDRKQASKLLEQQIRNAGNVKRYNQIISHEQNLDLVLDSEFCETTTARNNHQYDTLSTNLRTSRASLAKDAIYQSTIQLVHHLMLTGRMREAMGQLVNVKGYCGGLWQLQEVTLLLAEAWLCLGDFSRVRELYDPNIDGKRGNSVGAASGSGSGPRMGSSSGQIFLSKLNAARGVAYLAEGLMKEAANSFLAVTGELRNDFDKVLSKEDIALYGGLAALIALDRREMGNYFSVDKNGSGGKSGNSFRERLDIYPELRDAIQAYIRADYGKCLKLVDTLRKGWERDMYLAPQADSLWRRVRGKCLVQYFEPYSSVSLHAVMDSFAFKSVDEAEDVVADLLERKEIVGAKVDGVNRTLNASSADVLERRRRRIVVRKLGRMGDGLLDEVEDMILRMACIENGVIVGKVGAKTRKSRGRRRGWGDAMSKESDSNSGAVMWGLDSSDDDGGEAIMEVEDEDDLMDTDAMNFI